MVNSILSSEPTQKQVHIDLIAQDITDSVALQSLPSADILSGLLELCPEQDVWMYEPCADDFESTSVQAIFRLHSSRGIIFHMSCKIDENGNSSEWIGPYDITIPRVQTPGLGKALAA